MAIVVIVFMILYCTASAVEARQHPKFPRPDDRDLFRQEVCSSHNDDLRNKVIQKSKCGEPKEVFVELKLEVSYLQVTPSAVWVKRCVGLCEAQGSKCVATESKVEHVPVRIYNVKTDKERCSTYPLEVHESCGCCPISSEDCAAPRVFNPRKCSCKCPNMEERRSCLKKVRKMMDVCDTNRNSSMMWNRSKCICEPKRRVAW